jgi:hypothetical protein
MKICYLDLQINNPPEDYAINAQRYGGGACFARYAKKLLNNGQDEFYIYGSKANFENLGNNENNDKCFVLNDIALSYLRAGAPVKSWIPESINFDIIIFHHDCFTLNVEGLKAKLVHWALMGDGRANHPNTPYTLLYNPGEKAVHGKSFSIVIGKYVPEKFTQFQKNNYIFQCSRHDEHMNSIEVAKFCLRNKIKGIFAGPILKGYPLMDYIDNNWTNYIGLISEYDKTRYLMQATATTYLHTWNTAFNLSAVESLAYGTPIITSKRGCFNYLTLEGENGFFWSPESNLLELYLKCQTLDQEKVWKSAQRFSHTAMVNSFYKAFQEILKD